MENFEEYCRSIELPDSYIKRVKKMAALFEKIFPEPIEAIFITNEIDSEDIHKFENLWLFSKNYCGEAKKFISIEDIEILNLKELNSVNFKSREYEFGGETTIYSRLNATYGFNNGTKFLLSGSRENCKKIYEIYLKYFKPNL